MMKQEDMVLVSVDDHIIEPPGLFDRHIPAKWADRAPRLDLDTQKMTQAWVWEGRRVQTSFINAVVTLPKDEWGFDPGTLAEMRPGCWDVKQRVRDMDANGVLASMCFPSFPGMGGAFFGLEDDKELALACVQAYNDWHFDEWCASAPGRFIPLGITPTWDPTVAAAEVRRMARKGATAMTFVEDIDALGAPSLHSGEWDPLFAACVDEGVTLAIHIGSAATSALGSPMQPIDVTVTLPCWYLLPCLANFMWSKSLQKFPDLKIALSEGGTSWIPGFLDRMERHYSHQTWTGADLGGLTPTETFRRNFLSCFVSDPSGLLLRDRIGIDNIAYEIDYPHSDCTWPNSSDELYEHLEAAKCTDAEIDKITHENAAQWLSYDPFKHAPREEVTVGALKARAVDVDTRIRSRKEYAADYVAQHGSLGG